MQEFPFTRLIDPTNPLDPKDPPPVNWESLDTADFRRDLFGFSSAVEACRQWEVRELVRFNSNRKRDETK